MKKFVLLLTAIAFSTVSASALEPLILEPLNGSYNYKTPYNYNGQVTNNDISSAVDANVNANTNEGEVQLTPQYPSNMIPQNNAAKGLPVVKKQPRKFNIVTKQGTRTNTQWNPGGKGTKSYF